MKMWTCAAAACVCAVVATGAAAAPSKTYVLWLGTRVFVTADGHSWRNVTPRGAVVPHTAQSIDAVAFRGQKGWLIASDCVQGKGSLFRTADRGATWQKHPFFAHTCAGGANFSLDVLNDKRAWVLQSEPTGPGGRLLVTTNGGRTWELMSELGTYGRVTFVSATKGWLAGFRLLRTNDGGRTWHQQTVPAPAGYRGRLALLAAPRFFGRIGVLAGEYERERHVIGFYRSTDRGGHWRLLTTFPGSGPSVFPQFTLSAVSGSTDWVMTAGGHPTVHVTRDGGLHWTTHALQRKLYAPVALSARVAAASDFRGQPFITRDGGRTWRPLGL